MKRSAIHNMPTEMLAIPASPLTDVRSLSDRVCVTAVERRKEKAAIAIMVPMPKTVRNEIPAINESANATGTITTTAPVPANPCSAPSANRECVWSCV